MPRLSLICSSCLRPISSRNKHKIYASYNGGLEYGEYRQGLICHVCARRRIKRWMLAESKIVLYLSHRIILHTAALQLVAARLGYHEAERIRLAQIKAENYKRARSWKAECRRSPWPKSPSEPSKLYPTYEWFISDGVGSFNVKCYVKEHKGGGHNMRCCSRRDVWFTDWAGNEWWGIHLAQEFKNKWFSNDVVRCRKLKKKVT